MSLEPQIYEDEKFGQHIPAPTTHQPPINHNSHAHINNAHHNNARCALRVSCPPELTSPSKSVASSISYSPPSRQSLSTSLSTTPALRFLTDFEELKDVGKGGFGTVVKVRNKLDERDYAIKKIKLKKHDSNMNKKILREVSTLSRLAHENVVRYYQAWIEEGPAIDECKDPGYDEEDEEEETEFPSSYTNTSTASASIMEQEGNDDDPPSAMDEDSDDDLYHHDSLEDMVANPVFEGEEENFDPGIFFGHFEGPKKKMKRKAKKNSKKKKKKTTGECDRLCNVCNSFYRDWEVSFDEWRDKGVALQPINVCQNCYCEQLEELGVEISKLYVALKRQSKMVQYLYIQMEYCEYSLRDAINNRSLWQNRKPQPENGSNDYFIWNLFRQIVEGLVHIHSQRIIHRDLKPDNIFFARGANDEPKPKIGDFGLATTVTETSPSNSFVKNAGIIYGTYLYASPEMVNLTRSGYDEKVDIFALGIIFFEMWYPFSTGMERCKVLEALRNSLKLPPEFEQNPARELQCKILRWLLNKDPKLRPSALELLKLLPDNEKSAKNSNDKISDHIKSKEQETIEQLKAELQNQTKRANQLQELCSAKDAEIAELKRLLALQTLQTEQPQQTAIVSV